MAGGDQHRRSLDHRAVGQGEPHRPPPIHQDLVRSLVEPDLDAPRCEALAELRQQGPDPIGAEVGP